MTGHGKVKTLEEMKVYLLEVSNIGKCSHYQAIFNSFELADKARSKYLNDPACDPTKMKAVIFTHKIQTDLSILDIAQNQSSTPNCPSCNSDLVQEEGHEFGDPDGKETGIINHFHCTDCGQDFLRSRTKLVKHSETSLTSQEEK